MRALYLLKHGLSAYKFAPENLIAFNSLDTTERSTIIDSQILLVDHIHEFAYLV